MLNGHHAKEEMIKNIDYLKAPLSTLTWYKFLKLCVKVPACH